MQKKWLAALAAGVIGLLLFAAWGLGWFGGGDGYSSDPGVAELEKLRDKGLENQGKQDAKQKQVVQEEFRDRMKGLSEEQRMAFFKSSMPIFMRLFETQVDKFLALPPEKRIAVIDERITAMQKSGRKMQFSKSGKMPSPEKMDKFRKQMLDYTTPEQRAKFETAMKIFTERMKERGMALPEGGFF